MITPEELETIEKKYYNIYLELLQEKEEYIRKQVEVLQNRIKWAYDNNLTWKLDNRIAIGLQELIRGIFFRETPYEPFMLPMSSDTVFETKDAIIEIDIKTVKKNDDRGDDKDQVPAHPNQISYSGTYSTDSKCKHIGKQDYSFKGNVPTIIEGKPALTFFVKFIWFWKDEKKTEVQIGARDGYPAFTLSSVPNGLLSKHYQNLIINAKNYFYPLHEAPEDLKLKHGYEKLEKKIDRLNGIIDELKEIPPPTSTAYEIKRHLEEIKKLEENKHKIDELIIQSRLKFQNDNGYSIDTGRISMTEEKTKPQLTSGWKRHTKIFDW